MMIQTTVVDMPKQVRTSSSISNKITATVAQQAAQQYLERYFTNFEPVKPFFLEREGVWRFIVRSPLWPLGYIKVDAQTGEPLPFTPDEIRVLKEKAAIVEAEQRNALPMDEQGYVLREYAKTQAHVYLGDQLGVYFGAANGLFIPGVSPIWQFTITYRHPNYGKIEVMGILDVDAQTGNVIPLNDQTLQQLQGRTNAIIRHRQQTIR
ncbi:MAG: hypothetical protein U0350_49990 [Caldilineaceae bacterium]